MTSNLDKFKELVAFTTSANRGRYAKDRMLDYQNYLVGVQFALSTFGMVYVEDEAQVIDSNETVTLQPQQINEKYIGINGKHEFLDGVQYVLQLAQKLEMDTSLLSNLFIDIKE